MATQRERDAADYLQEHRIMELLENLSSMMFFYRPGPDSSLTHFTWRISVFHGDEHLSVRVSHVCFREAQRISNWAAAAAEGVSAERRHRTKSVQQRQPGHDLRDSGPHQSEIYYICPIQARWVFDTTLTSAWKASTNKLEPISSTHILYNMPFIHVRIFTAQREIMNSQWFSSQLSTHWE